ncbi:Spy/CpxP family protein refolding chaperone [Xanthobacter autotrophicus DSM 431]|uniref:Spy/CpxP family protein refolding chaperone n=1 Tax=Xanthobacter nonsaccharivorans TaxID=3119912 RepID=UPI003726D661
MTTFRNLMLASALLLATPGFAEDAHHSPEAQPAAPQAAVPQTTVSQAPAPAPQPSQAAPMPGGPQGMMGPGMMGMMGQGGMGMMGGGNAGAGMGMMGGAAAGAMGMGQMMDPGRIAGRIAFLKAELNITDAQQPLWNAFTEALKANRAMMGDMQEMMMAAQGAAAPTLIQRIEGHERMLATRLEAVRRLKAALGPLYASFDEAQKRTADQLMMPGGMGPM